MTPFLLITAGGTSEPIDPVRILTNRASGNTGLTLAWDAHNRGWNVELLLARGLFPESNFPFPTQRFESVTELGKLMESTITQSKPCGVIHSAAVSDYVLDYVNRAESKESAIPISCQHKIPGHLNSLTVVLKPAPRLLAKIRTDWRFKGYLASFKLETDPIRLLATAEESLCRNGCNLVVANTWEGHQNSAWLVFNKAENPENPSPMQIPRNELSRRILDHFQSQLPRPF